MQRAKCLVSDVKKRKGLELEWLLSNDNLDAQVQRPFRQEIWEANGMVINTPPAMTHQAAGIDRGYGRDFQHEFMVAQDQWCDETEDNYTK